MRTIETIATFTSSGEIHLSEAQDLPVGTYRVVLQIDDVPIPADDSPATVSADDSFLALAGDLVGCLEGLPSDLSHNKEYLEGLGS